MSEQHYTDEKNVQMLIYLMKAHNIKKVVASPGTTNLTFLGSIQSDPFFEIYSSVDERSAAYIACGLSEEGNEAVALTCTGATASRNYLSGLTEAYYRKLPILAITSTQHEGRIGQNIAQVIDRTSVPKDVAKISVNVPTVHDKEDEWACNLKLNKALLELTHNGGGPVHINLTTTYSRNYSIAKLPSTRIIKRFCYNDAFPDIKAFKVAVIVGSHKLWSEAQTKAVEDFCIKYNAVVLCDHTSNYFGKFAVHPSLLCAQKQYKSPCRDIDLLIDIGDVSGAAINLYVKEVWRVNPDGEIRDPFRKLTNVFQIEEKDFFEIYSEKKQDNNLCIYDHYNEWIAECSKVASKIPELPFSNFWIAKTLSDKLPDDIVMHFAILNTLRSWNFFYINTKYIGYCNTGGFGIDGAVSTIIGGALADPNHIHFGFVGDLAMFYDLNSLGNRHLPSNVRILVVNNGLGQEFRNYNHPAADFGEEANKYMAAAAHYGNKSKLLLKHFAEDLGFKYISAESKDEFLLNISDFTDTLNNKPIIFEVFTESEKENEALIALHQLEFDSAGAIKKAAKDILGEKKFNVLKNMIKK